MDDTSKMLRVLSSDITPCSPLKVNGRLGGTCSLHLQGRRIGRTRNRREAGSKNSSACYLLHPCFLLGLFFKLEATSSSETSADVQWTTAVRSSGPTTEITFWYGIVNTCITRTGSPKNIFVWNVEFVNIYFCWELRNVKLCPSVWNKFAGTSISNPDVTHHPNA
jgi:hypothetical protein